MKINFNKMVPEEIRQVGDYGYFWGNETKCFVYGQLLDVDDQFANPNLFLYKVQVKDIVFHFEHFSVTPPLSILIKT